MRVFKSYLTLKSRIRNIFWFLLIERNLVHPGLIFESDDFFLDWLSNWKSCLRKMRRILELLHSTYFFLLSLYPQELSVRRNECFLPRWRVKSKFICRIKILYAWFGVKKSLIIQMGFWFWSVERRLLGGFGFGST